MVLRMRIELTDKQIEDISYILISLVRASDCFCAPYYIKVRDDFERAVKVAQLNTKEKGNDEYDFRRDN